MKKIKFIKKKQLMWVDDFSVDDGNTFNNNRNINSNNPYVRYVQLIKGSKLEWHSK
jgi:hypothetical protein